MCGTEQKFRHAFQEWKKETIKSQDSPLRIYPHLLECASLHRPLPKYKQFITRLHSCKTMPARAAWINWLSMPRGQMQCDLCWNGPSDVPFDKDASPPMMLVPHCLTGLSYHSTLDCTSQNCRGWEEINSGGFTSDQRGITCLGFRKSICS